MTPLVQKISPNPHLFSSAVLADVLDALGHRHSALPSDIRPLKPEWRIFGRAATLSSVPVAHQPEKPYALEMECIDNLKSGEVLIATTNGDRDSALWGELLSTACWARQVAGVILDGLTRDTAQIIRMNYPVFAAGFSPLDSKGRLDTINFNQPICIGKCVVRPGDYVCGDVDGIVVIPAALAEQVFPKALEKITGENRVRAELARGRSVREVFAEYKIL